MKILKPLTALCFIAVLASCNTKNRPHINDIVDGTPTYSDSVLLDQHSNHPLPKGENDLKQQEYKR